jgi:prepilin-type N-terminal cleavage/methylation domain-containing protein
MRDVIKKIKNKKGFTLLELLAVLIILAIIGIGIYETLKSTSNHNDVQTETKNLNLIADLSAQLATPNSANPYSTINESGLINSQQVPNIQNGVIQNVWGGQITVRPLSLNGGTSNYFAITENSVPQKICNDFVLGSQVGFSYISVNGTIVFNRDGNVVLNAANVLGSCTSTTNTVIFGRS